MSEMSSKIVLNVVSVSSELLGCHFMHSYNIRLISIKDGVCHVHVSTCGHIIHGQIGIIILLGRNFLHLLLGK